MDISFNEYNVIIQRKRIKNIYIRVDSKLNIVVSAPFRTTNKEMQDLMEQEKDSILKMIQRINKREEYGSYFLGKKIDIVILNTVKHPILDGDILFLPRHDYPYLKYFSTTLFMERLKDIYPMFEENIPFPTLKVRHMKSKWGVCNKRNTSITLNTELMKRDMKYIDYVIVHELSHFVHMNHSEAFWKVVSKYMPDYKKIRKELRE